MEMSTYEATVSMIRDLPDNELLLVKEFIKRITSKDEIRKEMYNPYKPLTREEVIEQLAIAKKHSDEGRVMEGHRASANIREKYGL
ncbi:hypothetical protein [Oribacterium sp. NK2B42]|uniref:hypothetical protein n=1 Tax=Oribacterium sp. NK2B42 TaxID=689781 RepID=UPI0003FDC702|nr:hypothetical protein [Oribacterium sp. NK2B42]